MKQNKNTYVKIFSVLTAVIVFVSCISIPAFAYTDTSTNGVDFTDYPMLVEVNTLEGRDLNSIIIGTTSRGNGNIYAAFFGTYASDYYLFQYPVTGTNRFRVVFVGATTNSYSLNIYPGVYSVCGTTSRGSSITIGDTTYLYEEITPDLQGNSSGWGNYTLVDMPAFESLQAGLDALTDWISDPPIPAPITGEFTTVIQPGYAMYIDVTNLNVTFNMSQETPVSYWGLGATQFYGTLNAIPSTTTQNTVGNIIPWSGTGRADVYGKYNNWVSSLSVSGSASDHNHVYFCIINPLNNNSTAGSGYDVSAVANGAITLHASNSNHVKLVPLSTSFNAGVYDSVSGDTTATGAPDGSGGLTYTNDGTGETYVPSFGGLTTPDSQATTINDFLQNISNQISGFFKGAIGAVSTLVSSGIDFMRQVSSLYSWLPAPVYSVLTSAIILVITIGVIKVFI